MTKFDRLPRTHEHETSWSILTNVKICISHNCLHFKFVFYPLDSRNTKKPKTKMPCFYKQQSYFSQIVSKKAKITIYFFMKNSKNNNIILSFSF